ncbi:MAG: hypothetical protein WCJ35_06460 [Planctomycetota bacterium]
MAREPQVREASLDTSQPSPPKQSQSLGRLARRISAWTTNGLLTFMLVVIALGFGREVLHVWHNERSPLSVPVPTDSLGDAAAPHILEFGDQAWSIRRQEFSGRQSDLPVALQDACRAAMVDSRPRSEPADAAEQELLKRLASERPVAEEHGQWQLYQWGGGHPVLIGTRAVETADESRRTKVHPTKSGTTLDETTYRVVIWGVAVPAAANVWTLYLFQSGGAAGRAGGGSGEIPLPPGGHRLISIRAAAGGAIAAFSADDGDAARKFYDRWFADRGWTVAARWQQIALGWHARFEMRSPAPAMAVDIRLGLDPQSRWTGLVMESQLEKGKP